MKISLYQSYYKDEQKQHLNHYCIPFDNTANENPEYREYPQMKKVADLALRNGADLWGLISWKFEQKTLISPHSFLEIIHDNPGYDCYFINPCFILESFFPNPWAHGDWHHKGITQMALDGLTPMIGAETINVLTALYPRDRFLFCNYFVGNEKFWQDFFQFIDTFFYHVHQNEELKNRVYSPSGYAGDPELHNFIFLVERLVSTFLLTRPDIKTLNYEYRHEEVASKIDMDDFNSVRLQSDLKKEAVYRPHEAKTAAWAQFNRAMIQSKQQLIFLE